MIIMRSFFIIFIIIFSSCTRKDVQIEIVPFNPHPFLVDHSKMVKVYYGDSLIASQLLYADPGSGSPVHLIKNEDGYILIDSNGQWYKIMKSGIIDIGWHWMDDLPIGEITKLHFDSLSNKYIPKKVSSANLKDIYKFKDPLND